MKNNIISNLAVIVLPYFYDTMAVASWAGAAENIFSTPVLFDFDFSTVAFSLWVMHTATKRGLSSCLDDKHTRWNLNQK